MYSRIKILIVFFTATCFFTISCGSKDNQANIGLDVSETFSILKIEYYYTANSENKQIKQILPTIEYLNNTGLTQVYPFDPLEGYHETSLFSSDNLESFLLVSENEMLRVPIFINNENEISLGDNIWKYSNSLQKHQSNLDLQHYIGIPAKQKLRINSQLIFQRYTADYILVLIGNTTKTEKIVKGKWVGVYPREVELYTVFSHL